MIKHALLLVVLHFTTITTFARLHESTIDADRELQTSDSLSANSNCRAAFNQLCRYFQNPCGNALSTDCTTGFCLQAADTYDWCSGGLECSLYCRNYMNLYCSPRRNDDNPKKCATSTPSTVPECLDDICSTSCAGKCGELLSQGSFGIGCFCSEELCTGDNISPYCCTDYAQQCTSTP